RQRGSVVPAARGARGIAAPGIDHEPGFESSSHEDVVFGAVPGTADVGALAAGGVAADVAAAAPAAVGAAADGPGSVGACPVGIVVVDTVADYSAAPVLAGSN